MLSEFRAFIQRGNVLDLAVAVILGAAFGRVVTALVDGILMPPIGLLLGGVDFSSLFILLGRGDNVQAPPPMSLAQAREAGIPVLAYGEFINEVVQFLIVAFAVFLIVRQANRFRAPVAVTTKSCPRCVSTIPLAATRCPSCCVDL